MPNYSEAPYPYDQVFHTKGTPNFQLYLSGVGDTEHRQLDENFLKLDDLLNSLFSALSALGPLNNQTGIVLNGGTF